MLTQPLKIYLRIRWRALGHLNPFWNINDVNRYWRYCLSVKSHHTQCWLFFFFCFRQISVKFNINKKQSLRIRLVVKLYMNFDCYADKTNINVAETQSMIGKPLARLQLHLIMRGAFDLCRSLLRLDENL